MLRVRSYGNQQLGLLRQYGNAAINGARLASAVLPPTIGYGFGFPVGSRFHNSSVPPISDGGIAALRPSGAGATSAGNILGRGIAVGSAAGAATPQAGVQGTVRLTGSVSGAATASLSVIRAGQMAATVRIGGVPPALEIAALIAAQVAAAVRADLEAGAPVPVDVQRINNSEVIGTGVVGDSWRGVGVSP